MPGDLSFDYAALDRAAAAVRKAYEQVQSAGSSLGSNSHLSAGDFTDKGERAAAWYEEQRDAAGSMIQGTLKSYDAFGRAFSSAATVMRLQDEALARTAKGDS